MKPVIHKAALAATLGVLTMGATFVQAATELPSVQRAGGIEYLTGGIGKDEAMAIEKARAHWPLTLQFAVKHGQRAEFTADVKVMVRDAHGHTTLQTTADGPFLLARLAPGAYTVEATLASKTLRKTVRVRPGHATAAAFIWPAGADKSPS